MPRRQAAISALLIGVLGAGLVGATAPGAHADRIASKRAQAQAVLVQLQRLDAAAQRANSRYQVASRRLHRVEHQLDINRQALGVARGNLSQAQRSLEKRLVAIYTTEEQQSSLAVILGARSLDDLISRIETVNSLSKQDSSLINQVVSFRHQVVQRRTLLQNQRARQHRLVVARAAARDRAAGRVASERRLYGSVKAQLRTLIAQQEAAQAAAARQARAAAQVQASAPTGSFGVGDQSGGSVPSTHYSGVVGIAMHYLGTPYVWGGSSPSGFDCSGFVMYVFAQVGISLPHYTVAQWSYPNAVSVPRDELQPGDLVFFAGLGHVGIYVGNGQFIHAPHTGDVVRIDSLSEGWYSSEYDGAKRILG
ncbi:MAG TPA: NlpC/P60 family protein [Gaiellaceae bacterium]|nr:NlpC/P60 family protein [Gaiellaceae bacterium]